MTLLGVFLIALAPRLAYFFLAAPPFSGDSGRVAVLRKYYIPTCRTGRAAGSVPFGAPCTFP
jgi:hypothetical protein